MSVPDLITEDVLSRCGVPVGDGRTMVYSLDDHSLSESGIQ